MTKLSKCGQPVRKRIAWSLAGIPKSVEAIIRSCEDLEKNRMRLVTERPFLVVRAAGSGMDGSGDLLALWETFVFQLSQIKEGW